MMIVYVTKLSIPQQYKQYQHQALSRVYCENWQPKIANSFLQVSVVAVSDSAMMAAARHLAPTDAASAQVLFKADAISIKCFHLIMSFI